MRSTFRILMYLKKGSEKPDGNVPLMCRLTVDGEIKQFSCKMDLPPCEVFRSNDYPVIAWRTHRNSEPYSRTYEYKDHANICPDNQPEDKSGYGNPLAQAGGYGEEYPEKNITKQRRTFLITNYLLYSSGFCLSLRDSTCIWR